MMQEIPSPNAQPSKPEAKKAPPKKSRWIKRLLWWTTGLVVLLPIGLVALFLIMWQVGPARQLALHIGLGVAAGFLDGKLEVKELGGTLLGGISLRGVRWMDKEGKLMAGLESLEVEYDLMGIIGSLGGTITVTKVRLVRPEGHLATDAKGQINLLAHLKSSPPKKLTPEEQCREEEAALDLERAERRAKAAKTYKPSTFRLDVASIKIEDLLFTWTSGGQTIRVSDFQLATNFLLHGPLMSATISKFHFAAKNPDVALKELTLAFEMDEEIRVKNFRLRFGDQSGLDIPEAKYHLGTLATRASITNLLLATTDLKKIVPSYPVKPDLKGSIAVTGTLNQLHPSIDLTLGKLRLALNEGMKDGMTKASFGLGMPVPDQRVIPPKRLCKGWKPPPVAAAPPPSPPTSPRLSCAALFSPANQALIEKQPHYNIKLTINPIDISDILVGKNDMPSKIGLTVKACGTGLSANTDGEAHILVQKGTFQTYAFETIDILAVLRQGEVTVQKFLIDTPYALLQKQEKVKNKKGREIPGRLRVRLSDGYVKAQIKGQIADLSRVGRLVKQNLRGQLSFSTDLEGTKWLPTGKIAVSLRDFAHPSAKVKKLDLTLGVKDLQAIHADVSLKSEGIAAGGQKISVFETALSYKMKPKGHDIALSKLDFNLGTGLFKLKQPSFVSYAGTKATIKNLRLEQSRRREFLLVDGYLDVGGKGQDITVRVGAFDLKGVPKLVPGLPVKNLGGLFGLALGFKGSFAKPKVDLTMTLRQGSFNQFSKMNLDLALGYKDQRFQLKNLRVDADNGQSKLLKMAADIPVTVAIQGMPAQPLAIKKPLSLTIDLPDLSLDWIGTTFKQPLGGNLKAQIRVTQTLENPKFSMDLTMTDLRWDTLKNLGVRLLFDYESGSFSIKEENNWVKIDGKRLVSLQGQLPLYIKLYEETIRSIRKGKKLIRLSRPRKQIASRFSLDDKDWSFQLKIHPQQVEAWKKFIPANLRHLRGRFSTVFALGGRPRQPEFSLAVKLENASMCPLEGGKHICTILPKRQRGVVGKPISLRVSQLGFHLHVGYKPSSSSDGWLALDSAFTLGKKTLFLIKPQSGVRMGFSVDPENFKPTFALHDAIDFTFEIPDLSVRDLRQFLRLPALQSLQGNFLVRLELKERMSKPRFGLTFQAKDTAYAMGLSPEGRTLFLDKIQSLLQVNYHAGQANVALDTKILNQPFLDLKTTLAMQAGFDPKNYKTTVAIGRAFATDLQIKPFALDKLHYLGGSLAQIAGTLDGSIKVSGDPACLRLGASHIEMRDVILGEQPSRQPRRRSNEPPKSPKALKFSHFRLEFNSMPDGRSEIELWLVQKGRKEKRASRTILFGEKLLTGLIRAGLPLAFETAKTSAEMKERCPFLPNGKAPEELVVRLDSPGINLQFVEAFAEGIKMNGNLQMTVNLGGTLSAPEIKSGRVGVFFQELLYPAYGVELRRLCTTALRTSSGFQRQECLDTSFFVYLEPKNYRLDGSFQGKTGTPFKITGSLSHKNFVPDKLSIDIAATNFQPMATPQYRLTLQSEIKVKGTLSAPKIKGKITIPQMIFTLPESSRKPDTYTEDGDICVQGEESAACTRIFAKNKGDLEEKDGLMQRMSLTLDIQIPRNFFVRNRDMNIEAKTPDLQNLGIKLRKGRLTLSGGIQLLRGEYTLPPAYSGKKFLIDPGSEIQFTGQSVTMDTIGSIDPKLRITAIHLINLSAGSQLGQRGIKKAKVLLKVSGSAQDPQIDFEVLDAATDEKVQMDRLNVLSLLITGTTTEDLSRGQQSNLASQAVGMVGSAVSSELKNAISGVVALDVLNIEAGTRLQDIKMEVGWYLTPDLYLEFALKPVPLEEESLWEARLDYAINRRFSLELRSGQLKRNDILWFRGSGHLFFKMKY